MPIGDLAATSGTFGNCANGVLTNRTVWRSAGARGQYFNQDPPASTMVAVSAFTHPDMMIEINAIAVLP